MSEERVVEAPRSAVRRAECEAYAGAVTDWEWAHYAFHA